MQNSENAKSLTVSQTKILVKAKEYPLMQVEIAGTPSLGDMLDLMKRINKLADEIEGDYISVTDMSKLAINDFFRKIILYGMEKTYNAFVSVKHRAKISFVILADNSGETNFVKNSLQNINNVEQGSFAYNYIFITDLTQVANICEKML